MLANWLAREGALRAAIVTAADNATQKITATESATQKPALDPNKIQTARQELWRITHLLSAEDGPWDVVIRLRRWTGEGFWGKLLDCFYCLSVWISAPLGYLTGESLA